MKPEYKYVMPPDRVSVSVLELHALQEKAAMLVALEQAGVKQWSGYSHARHLFNTSDLIFDIRQGWKPVA